jgi:ATP-binding cassette, subfamily F, member 3
MFTILNLTVQFSGNELFSQITFNVNPNDRIGLVGKNGAGKSTMLKIIAGQMEPETGNIVIPDGKTVGYLPQEMFPDSHKTIFDETLTAFEELNRLEKKIEALTHEITNRTDYESDSYHKLVQQLSECNERHHIIGGTNKDAEAEKVLMGLGFERSDFIRSCTEFSSGWQMRVELAKILLKRPDLLLLDEPTNHLDIESIQWLESFLTNYPGSVMLVSHDRTFLDTVTNRTIEIVSGRIYDYKASYSDFVELREERRQSQLAALTSQQREIAQIENFVERFRYKATKAKQVQSRLKMLDKMERIEIDDKENSTIHFKFPPAPHSGIIVVEARELVKNYGEKNVLNKIDFTLEKGESVAFVGRNGEGKSTFSRIIVGDLDYEGHFRLGHQVSVGYFAQNQSALLDGELTVFDTLDQIAVGDIRTKLRNILGSFLFSGEDIDKKVKVLSGGEKARLALAKLLLTPVNLLVLDEPTNHLDMVSKDILKNALLQYDGSLIIVSHDRDFLQGLTDKVIEFRNHQIKTHIGDIQEFLESRKLEDLKELEQKAGKQSSNQIVEASAEKLNRERKKEMERELRKYKNKLEQCESEITKLEDEQTKLNKKLENIHLEESNDKMNQIFARYNEVNKILDEKMLLWEEIHNQITEFQDKNY